jgi:iron complex transport system substrate-binding protein
VRVVSLLPGATEILFALGLGPHVVGTSHECDHPEEARLRPRVVRTVVDPTRPSQEVDRRVRELVASGRPVFLVDLDQIRALRPDVVISQAVCEVCAVGPRHVVPLHEALPGVRMVYLQATSLEGVWEDVRRVAEACGVPGRGRALIGQLQDAVRAVSAAVAGRPRVRVACVEWLDPPYVAGHWVPQMVRWAGGQDVLGEPGRPSWRTTWDQVDRAEPEVVVLMPCGFSLEAAWDRRAELAAQPAFLGLRALREGFVYVVDANAQFSRPGPRLVEGLRTLAALLHPGCGFEPVARRLTPQDLPAAATVGDA